MSRPFVAIGAFEVLGDHEGRWFGPRILPDNAIRNFVALAERDGLITRCDGQCDHTLILDLYEGDVMRGVADDRCVVDAAAWAALNSELELAVNGR